MKKIMAALSVTLLIILSLGLWGCGSDDPADPPTANCSISVTTPVAGDSYMPGDADHETIRIRWTHSGDGDFVKIELLKANAVVGVIHPSVSAAIGYYSWTASNLGEANGADFSIRVSTLGEEDCSDTSAMFTMTSIVGCTMDFSNDFPDSVVAGDIFHLTWDSHHTSGQVDIQLRKQDQLLAYIATRTEDDGSFDWEVDSFHNGTYDYYFLRIQDSDVDACYADSVTFKMVDDDICSIVVSGPHSGAVWDAGTEQTIMLTATAEVNTVDLRLFTGNIYVGMIGTDISMDDFPYSWTVNDFGNTQGPNSYRVVATNSDDAYCTGRSGAFTITP